MSKNQCVPVSKRPSAPGQAGRPVELGAVKEQELAAYLFVSGRCGFGLSRYEVLELTGEFVREEKIKTRWTNGTPGLDWLRSFLRRYPQMIIHKDDVYPMKQEEEIVDEYRFHQDLEHLYEDEGVALDDADRFYSLLELSFPCEEHYSNNLTILQDNHLKTSILTCICANGEMWTPVVVFQGDCLCCDDKRNVNNESSRPLFDHQTLFYYWLKNIFIPNLPRSDKSTILFYEGHSLWNNLRVLKLARKTNIILVKFPPKIADTFQPLNSSYSLAFKSAYNELLQRGSQEDSLNSEDAERLKFGKVVGEIWGEFVKKNDTVNGFERTGLFPLDKLKFFKNDVTETLMEEVEENNEQDQINDEVEDSYQSVPTSEDSDYMPSPKILQVASVFREDAGSRHTEDSNSSENEGWNQSSSSVSSDNFTSKEIINDEEEIPQPNHCNDDVKERYEDVEDTHEDVEDTHEHVEETREDVKETREDVKETREVVEETQEDVEELLENVDESQEDVNESHENVEKSHDNLEESHENVEESHENVEESSLNKTLKDGAVALIKKAVEVIDNRRRSKRFFKTDKVDEGENSTISNDLSK